MSARIMKATNRDAVMAVDAALSMSRTTEKLLGKAIVHVQLALCMDTDQASLKREFRKLAKALRETLYTVSAVSGELGSLDVMCELPDDASKESA